MTIAELKKLISEIDEEHDWEEVWYVEISGQSTYLIIQDDLKRGTTIIGDRQ